MNALTIWTYFFLILAPLDCQRPSGEKTAVRQLITEAYLEPLYEKGDLAEIRAGFHPDFSMYVLYKGRFYINGLEKWLANIEKNRAKNLPPKSYSWKFESIDVSGQTAVVKLRIKQDGKLKYVDYLTLYKFENGWKVITKQFSMY